MPLYIGHLLVMPTQWLYLSVVLAFSCPVSSRQIQQKFFLHFSQHTQLQVPGTFSMRTLCTHHKREPVRRTDAAVGGKGGGGGQVCKSPQPKTPKAQPNKNKNKFFFKKNV